MRWLVATLNEYVKPEKGEPSRQFLPNEQDWYTVLCNPVCKKLVKDATPKFFEVQSTPMPNKVYDTDPDLDPPVNAEKLEWRAAGGKAWERSAAATAYLRLEYRVGFRNVHKCWIGL